MRRSAPTFFTGDQEIRSCLSSREKPPGLLNSCSNSLVRGRQLRAGTSRRRRGRAVAARLSSPGAWSERRCREESYAGIAEEQRRAEKALPTPWLALRAGRA